MRRLTAEDYSVDAVTGAKMLVGAWLCRRLDDGTVVRRRALPKQRPTAARFGIMNAIL